MTEVQPADQNQGTDEKMMPAPVQPAEVVKAKDEPVAEEEGKLVVPAAAETAAPAQALAVADAPRVFRVKAGKPITSHFLSLFKITAKSRRTDFETKWGAKERVGSVMSRQTAKMGKGEGQRNSTLLVSLFKGLSEMLPIEGKQALAAAIVAFMASKDDAMSEETFSEAVKTLVDRYNIVVPFDDTCNQHPWRCMGAGGIHPKQEPSNDVQEAVAAVASGGSSKGGRASGEPRKGTKQAAAKEKRRREAEAKAAASQAAAAAAAGAAASHGAHGTTPMGSGQHAEIRSEKLSGSSLGKLLTGAVRGASRCGTPTVKVVGETVSFDGGFPHRTKAIFVFQEFNARGDELLIACMYVHEYGPQCPAPNAGRVYVESLDACPLRGKEGTNSGQSVGSDTSAILRALLVAYFQYAKSIGLQYCHFRVPPPTEKSSVFAHRPAEASVLAAACGVKWLQRQLWFAVRMRVIDSFASEAGRPELMTSLQSKHEEEWNNDEENGGLDEEQSVLLSQRHIVVKLKKDTTKDPLAMDHSPLMDRTFAVSREQLVQFLVKERLSFHTTAHAAKATRTLLTRLLREQARANSRTLALSRRTATGGGVLPSSASASSSSSHPAGGSGAPVDWAQARENAAAAAPNTAPSEWMPGVAHGWGESETDREACRSMQMMLSMSQDDQAHGEHRECHAPPSPPHQSMGMSMDAFDMGGGMEDFMEMGEERMTCIDLDMSGNSHVFDPELSEAFSAMV